MQFIQGQGLDEVLDELRRLRGRPRPTAPRRRPAARRRLGRGAPSPAALLTGRFAATRSRPDRTRLADDGAAGAGRPAVRAGRADSASPLAARPVRPTSEPRRPSRSRSTTAAWPGSASRWPRRWPTPTRRAILHRDIKPSNLLLDAAGHGLGHRLRPGQGRGDRRPDPHRRHRRHAALHGPGAVRGPVRPARATSTAWALTLYELLTLRPAFDEPNRARLIEQVLHDEPAPPRQARPAIPRDLETIVLKAIAKEPARRYATAEQLAEDLRRFLADRPILARRISPAERAWRWCRRNPALAGASRRRSACW